MLFRRSISTAIAATLATSLLTAPLPAAASLPAAESVVAPDAGYLATEMQRARDVFAATTISKAPLLRATIAESAIERPAARPFTPFAVIDPKTGKTIPRSATIVLTTGKHKGESVNAGTYWDQVNALETSIAKAGGSLRDTRPTITGSLRINASALKGGPGANSKGTLISKSLIASGPKDLGQSDTSDYTPGGTPALVAQRATVAANLLAPQPCLNAPTFTVRTTAIKASSDSLVPRVGLTLPSPSPTPAAQLHTLPILEHSSVLKPTPTPSPAGGALFEATTVKPPTASVMSMQNELALEQQKCPNPLSPLPAAYEEADLASFFGSDQNEALSTGEIGDPSVAAVQFDGNVDVSAGPKSVRKPAPLLTAAVDAKAYLFSSEADFLSATASAGGEKTGTVDLMILGQSVETKSLATGSANGGTSNSYTVLNVGASIPIVAGISVDLAANVSGTLGLNYSIALGSGDAVSDQLSLEETGKLDGTFNASMDVNAIIVDVSGGVRGNLQFAAFDIPANGALQLAMIDRTIGGKNDHNPRDIRDCQLSFAYVSGVGGAQISALTGQVVAYARECIEYLVGSSCSEQDVTIANFTGSTFTPSVGTPWKTASYGPRYSDGPSYGIPLTSNERFSPDDPKTAVPNACNRFPIQYAN